MGSAWDSRRAIRTYGQAWMRVESAVSMLESADQFYRDHGQTTDEALALSAIVAVAKAWVEKYAG